MIQQLRRKNGIQNIKVNVHGATISPKVFRTTDKNSKEDGVLDGDFKGTFFKTKQFICPHWDEAKGQWCWGSSPQKLAELIAKMDLRYTKSHRLAGLPIEPGDVEKRLTNFNDEVFRHPSLYGKYYMENGRASLNDAVPDQEFLLYCYKGNKLQVDDRGSDEIVSKYVQAGTTFEIVSPRKENVKKKVDADREVKAITLLASMNGDENRMRAIAEIMDLPGYGKHTDANGLFLLLKDMAAQNTNKSAKYGKTYQDRFIEVASLSDDDLNVTHQIMRAKTEKGIIRKRTDHYLFNGEKLEGINNDLQLIKFFRDLKNQDKYLELINLLASTDEL